MTTRAIRRKMTAEGQKAIEGFASELGIESEKALELADKCYDEIYWRPFGGATSFQEIDDNRKASQYTMAVEDTTYQLRSIVDNIVSNEEIGIGAEKAAAIQSAATEYSTRVNSIKLGDPDNANKTLWEKFKEFVAGPKPVEVVADSEVVIGKAFKIYKDASGAYRWMSVSSNAYEDLDKELFTTEALEEAVEYADKENSRGPLLVFHVPSAVIGQCDYQGVAGRFLIESGTFDDTDLGRKALEYYQNVEEEQQVSIGYKFLLGDELDGQYDWLRFRERSVCPPGTAANPWTSFKVIGDEMRADKVEELEKIFGKEMATSVIANAEARTKELDESGIRHKEASPAVDAHVVTLYKTAKGMQDGEIKDQLLAQLKEMNGGKEIEAEDPAAAAAEEATTPPAFDPAPLAAALAGIQSELEALGGLKEIVTGLQNDIKELKTSDDEKISARMTPRGNLQLINRPTESSVNLVEGGKEIEFPAGTSVDPAAAYVSDLIGAKSN